MTKQKREQLVRNLTKSSTVLAEALNEIFTEISIIKKQKTHAVEVTKDDLKRFGDHLHETIEQKIRTLTLGSSLDMEKVATAVENAAQTALDQIIESKAFTDSARKYEDLSELFALMEAEMSNRISILEAKIEKLKGFDPEPTKGPRTVSIFGCQPRQAELLAKSFPDLTVHLMKKPTTQPKGERIFFCMNLATDGEYSGINKSHPGLVTNMDGGITSWRKAIKSYLSE